MKKKLLKFFIIIGVLALLLTLISTTRVQAVLQSNPNTHGGKKVNPTNWITYFRNMEVNGGALGLKEIINGTTKLATTESNNLDSHMMKSTEYGAIAILSASGYGNPKILQHSTIKTTTGNETGIYYVYNDGGSKASYMEYVAGGLSGYVFSGVNARYYDAYTTSNTSAKVGDALGTSSTANKGCTGWHSAGYSTWVDKNNPFFRRCGDAVFAFTWREGDDNDNMYSRGVVVCGEGL